MPAIVPTTSISITNVAPGQTIGVNFPVAVSYTNGLAAGGQIALGCDASNNPGTPAPNASDNVTINLTHALPAQNHALTATLSQDNVVVASCAIPNVNVGPAIGGIITLTGTESLQFPAILPATPLSGLFDKNKGNLVMLLVLDAPKFVNGVLVEPQLMFADPAIVTVEAGQGKWKHVAIPGAKKGQRLQIVLTKDGVVKTLIQAVYK